MPIDRCYRRQSQFSVLERRLARLATGRTRPRTAAVRADLMATAFVLDDDKNDGTN